MLVLSWGFVSPVSADWESGINLEGLASDDIVLSDSLVYLRYRKLDTEALISFKHARHWIDYRPPDSSLVGEARDRDATKNSLRLSAQGRLRDDLLWLFEGGGYAGFVDYQSLWIDEYFRQQFAGYPGYEETDPMGADALIGVRWDYLKESGFFQFSLFGGGDRITPQWEADVGKPLTSTDSSVQFIGTRLELENVLSTRLRTHNSLSMVDNSERSPRWSFETMNNYALTDSWVLKGTMGAAVENPDFHAFWTTLAAEWDHQQTWFLGLNFRFYTDSGELDGFSTYGVAAPPATTFGTSATLRWIQGEQQASFGIGPYWTRYDQADNTSPVSVLFEDRSWLSVQAAWSCRF